MARSNLWGSISTEEPGSRRVRRVPAKLRHVLSLINQLICFTEAHLLLERVSSIVPYLCQKAEGCGNLTVVVSVADSANPTGAMH